MRKAIICLLVLFCFASVSQAMLTVTEVSLVQVSGASADYDASTGTLTWSASAAGALLTSDYDFAQFTTASISATITGGVDATSGGYAAANFTGGTWEMVLGSGIGNVNLGGTFAYYDEEELAAGSLAGIGVVTVDTATFDLVFFGGLFNIPNIQMQWGDGNGLGGLFSSVLFTPGTEVEDYLSDYSSDNVTITLVSDETSVPEPVTVCLLGLGAVALRRRKR